MMFSWLTIELCILLVDWEQSCLPSGEDGCHSFLLHGLFSDITAYGTLFVYGHLYNKVCDA